MDQVTVFKEEVVAEPTYHQGSNPNHQKKQIKKIK
jgi:hypothetical protein